MFINLKLVLQLLKDVFEVTFLLHYFQNQLQNLLVDILDQVCAVVSLHHSLLAVDQDDLDDVGELLAEHLVQEFLLFFLDQSVLLAKVFIGLVEKILADINALVIILFKVRNEFVKPP